MKTIIYLVRHTQTIGNVQKRLTGRSDYELTPEGKIFVHKLTERLKEVRFECAYSSGSNRTLKTILPLAELNELQIIQEDALDEMYFGIYDGWTWEEVNKINPKIDKLHKEKNEIMEIPEQETTAQVAERMYKEIEKIARDNLGKTILICSHGVAIEAFIRKIKNQNFLEEVEKNSQKNTSVNILEYEDGKFTVKLLNDISHIK